MGFAAFLLISRSIRRQSELLNFSITGRSATGTSDEMPSGTPLFLAERAAIFASGTRKQRVLSGDA